MAAGNERTPPLSVSTKGSGMSMCTSNANQWHYAPMMQKAVTTTLLCWQWLYVFASGVHHSEW